MEPKRILVVANQTLGGSHLDAELKRRMDEGPCWFSVVVPATPPQDHLTWTEGEALEVADHRLASALTRFKAMGADVDGWVGDPSPIEAIRDAMRAVGFDEIILSTLPPGASKWLKQDLPHRIRRSYEVPLTVVAASREKVA